MPSATDAGDDREPDQRPEPDTRTPSYARKHRSGQRYSAAERDALMPEVLRILSIAGTVSEASRQTGVSRSTIWLWRERWPAFDEAYREAELEADDVIRGAMIQRGVVGVDRVRPIYHQGIEVGTERWKEYSDRCLLAIAAARMPEYRPKHELSGPSGGPIQTERVNDDSDDRTATILGILADAGALGPANAPQRGTPEDDEVHPGDEA